MPAITPSSPRTLVLFLSLCLSILPCVELQRQSYPRRGDSERIPVALLFWYVPDHGDLDTVPPYWHDPGFRGAMRNLHLEHKIDTVWFNIAKDGVSRELEQSVKNGNFAFVLSKGCWHTPSDKFMRSTIIPNKAPNVKTGIFPACSSPPPDDEVTGVRLDMAYDVLFYDKHWLRETFAAHPMAVHAFGVDTPTTFNSSDSDWATHPKLFDYVSVGMFAPWKRHEAITEKKGSRLVVGYGWRSEVSSGIVSTLFTAGVAVWQQVPPEHMCAVYRASRKLLMAATELGGGERVILEARACGMPVEAIELLADNSRLQEFITSPIYSSAYYASQFALGIRAVLPTSATVVPGTDGGSATVERDQAPAKPEPFRISV